MEKKQIIIYSGILVLGLGAMVGTVLYLRSRNAPAPDSGVLVNQPTAKPAGSANVTPNITNTADKTGVRPYKKIESYPVQRGWQQGDPPIVIPKWPTAEQMDNGAKQP